MHVVLPYVQQIHRALTSRISRKIIIPYLVLLFIVAVILAFVTVRLTAGALQDRISNRLIISGQSTTDALVAVEDEHLSQLRAIVFTQGVGTAIEAADTNRLAALLRPQWANLGLSTLVVFDQSGNPLLTWERAPNGSTALPPNQPRIEDLPSWWIVQQIVQGRRDAIGDKYSAFHGDRLYTAAPVRRGERLVGGVMVGIPLDLLLQEVQRRSQADVTTLYDGAGRAVATTIVRTRDTVIPMVPEPVMQQLRSGGSEAVGEHLQTTILLNGREHQVAYSPLQIRRAMAGFFSVALSRQPLIDTWAQERLPLAGLAFALVLGVAVVGAGVARRVTQPLQELVGTATAVSTGELERRSQVTSADELGVLAKAFNHMTERLLHLYSTSRVLSARTNTAAVLDATELAIQELMPGTAVFALLEDPSGWRLHVSERASATYGSLRDERVVDTTAILALVAHAQQPVVARRTARRLRMLPLPDSCPEVCYVALTVDEQPFGLLLLIPAHAGQFQAGLLAPVTAITSMATTAFHNTRLYAKVQDESWRHRVILESIADGVVVCDAERTVVLMNAAAEQLLEVCDWQRRRYRFTDLPLSPVLEYTPRLGGNDRVEMRYEAHGRILQASAAPLGALGSEGGGEVIVLHNISAEAALEQAKTDVIALISHELRTPLTSIVAANDMLIKGIGGELNPLQRELAQTSLRQSHAMSTLIDKAIMLAQIESGSLQLHLQPVHVRTAVEQVVQRLRVATEAAGAEISVEVPVDVPLALADVDLLTVALQQVIENAIKYGSGGAIRVCASATATGIALAISDQGPGIEPEELGTLFRRLRRGSERINDAARGMGLGLVITREVLERQGATITAHSCVGSGSTFTIILQEAVSAAQPLVA